MKFSADAESEVKFAHIRIANISHLRSKYFTAKLFHLPVKANLIEKNSDCVAIRVLFCGGDGED